MSAMPSLSAPDEVLPGRPESLKTPVDSEADQVASSWLQVQDPRILLRNLVNHLITTVCRKSKYTKFLWEY